MELFVSGPGFCCLRLGVVVAYGTVLEVGVWRDEQFTTLGRLQSFHMHCLAQLELIHLFIPLLAPPPLLSLTHTLTHTHTHTPGP